MNTEHKYALSGFVAGLIVCAVGGAYTVGWNTDSQAAKMSEEAATAAVISAMTPICVQTALADTENIDGLYEANRYAQRAYVAEAGWTNQLDNPSTDLKRGLSSACATKLVELKTQQAKSN